MHDPMTALGTEPEPAPTPWESLAQQARWLADQADRLADLDPVDLAPTEDQPDQLAILDERIRALTSTAAACRRATWTAIADRTSQSEVARLWGISRVRAGRVINAR